MPKSKINAQTKITELSDMGSALDQLDTIFNNLRTLVAKAYESGGASATAHILNLASQVGNKPFTEGNIRPRRAPRGAARSLVEKALADGPKTIREIRASASTDVDRALSYQTVRLELERGKMEKKYKKSKNKWSVM